MSKTFKTSMIFCITTVWLLAMRMLVANVNLGDYVSSWFFSFMVQIVGMGLIPLLLYRFWVKEDPFEGFYMKRKIRPVIYVFAVLIGILVSFLTPAVAAVWQTTLRMIGYTPTSSVGTVYPVGNTAYAILAAEFFVTAILPAVFEEINYRGLGMQIFAEVEDDRKKILFIGILFGLGHQFVAQTGYAFVGGLIFAYVVIKTRSIIPAMIIHFINNAVSVIADFSSQTTGGFYAFRQSVFTVFFKNIFLLLLFTGVLTVLLFVLLRLIKRYSQAEEVLKEKEDEYYYPNKTQYVDDIFGDLKVVRETAKPAVMWYEYAPLYASVAIMVISTVYTFIWGVGR
ncbi:MAG: CPBP family intramembrane metalloprotease [Clostridia bacterium]|nr:CPBP family intramembrane metalloprotease [Clostridia bacterium]